MHFNTADRTALEIAGVHVVEGSALYEAGGYNFTFKRHSDAWLIEVVSTDVREQYKYPLLEKALFGAFPETVLCPLYAETGWRFVYTNDLPTFTAWCRDRLARRMPEVRQVSIDKPCNILVNVFDAKMPGPIEKRYYITELELFEAVPAADITDELIIDTRCPAYKTRLANAPDEVRVISIPKLRVMTNTDEGMMYGARRRLYYLMHPV
jgi:hypothetical protein